MTQADRHRRLRALLDEVEALHAEARAARLDALAAEDASLAADVRRLLTDPGVSTGDLAPTPPGAVSSGTHLGPGVAVGPYRLEAELGAGGMGTVFSARDVARGERVALKVIHAHLAARPGARERFAREATLGSRVKHPRVVRTLGAGRADVDGRPVDYVVLEYVRGRDLAALKRSQGPLSEALLREVAAQAADGLAAIHDAGIVHRDIKPENLLVTESHELRIMDLGVARPLHAETVALTSEGQFVGSLAYAAPEQLAGEDATPRSDLYALGAALRDLLRAEGETGPSNLATWLSPSRSKPDHALTRVSPFFAGVIGCLLERDPVARFASAHELLDVLRAGESSAWWRRREALERRPPRARVSVARDATWRGRTAERRMLDDELAAVVAGGRARVLDVLGPPGQGKTRLAAEWLATLPDDVATFYGAYPAGGWGGGLRTALLAAYGGAEGDARLAARLDAPEHAIRALRAWLRGEAGPEAGGVSVTGLAARLFASLAQTTPVVLVLDDVQESPREARRHLDALVAGVRGERVLVLRLTDRALDELTERALAPADRTLTLGPLAQADAEALVREVFGDEAHEADDVERLARRAEGMPLYLLELARDRHAATTTTSANVPAALAAHVARRLEGLPDEEAEVLAVAAVEGPTFDLEPLVRVRGVSRLRLLELLDRLERRRRLVRADGSAWRFEHPLLQEVVYAGLPPALRAEIHRALAQALLPDGTGDGSALTGAQAARFASHHLRGPEPERALACLEAALDHLEAVGPVSTTGDWIERALERAARDPALRVRLWCRLAHARRIGARLLDAMDAARQGTAEARAAGVDMVGPLTEEGYGNVELARYDEATRVLEAALAALPADGSEQRRSVILGGLGQAAWHRGELDVARRWQETVLELGRSAGRPRIEARGAADLSVLLQESGHHEEAERLARRALELQEQVGDHRNRAVTMGNLGNVLFEAGQVDEALAVYEQASALARASGFRVSAMVTGLNRGICLTRLGRLEEAEGVLARVRDAFADSGMVREEAYAWNALGGLAHARGELATAREAYGRALERRRALGDGRGSADTLQLLAALEVDAGRPDDAAARLDEAEAACAPGLDVSQDALVAARRAALGRGELTKAQAAYEAAGSRLRQDARIEVLHLLALASGDLRYAEEARELLRAEAERLAPEARAAFLAGLPVHRALMP
ncbi:MAG: protein kinase [Planctomycetes bacterium]|nr:protein kinase [Planctomycetota bacterium]MCB9901948.1 protein kinase [Planctomycetota bacterium]